MNTSKLALTALVLLFYKLVLAQPETDKSFFKSHSHEPNYVAALNSTSNYDVTYHKLDIEVNPPVKYIEGSVTTYFVPKQYMNAIYFDFRNDMDVDSVIFHGSPTTYFFASEVEFRINFPVTLSPGIVDSVTIYYNGHPSSGGFGAFSVQRTLCSAQDSVMWTLSEPYGAKNWWPCKEVLTDKIDSIEMVVTAPKKYHIASNGILQSRLINGNKVTDHWKHSYPIPAYLVAFAASPYAIYSDTIDLLDGGQLEVLNYVFPCDSANARSKTRQLDTVMNFFIHKFGSFPYENEKYGHAQCMFSGGMEHTTMTFMGGWWYSILIHELAHQWFGNKVTCGSWHDIWLNEGFATYLEGLTCEQGIQTTSFQSWLNNKKNYVLSNNYGSVYCDDTTRISRIFSSRLSYNKGAYLLHMLRWVVGDDDFFAALYNYINDPILVYDFARTPDLQSHLETVADTSLTEFFNDWYFGEGWPIYDVKWSVDLDCNNKLRLSIGQQHSAGAGTFFEMPVPIRFSNGSEDTTLVFNQNSPADSLFFYSLPFIPTSASFDPELWICAQSTVSEVSLPVKTIHWTGENSSDWNSELNWDCGTPSMEDEVVLPAGSGACVLTSGSLKVCKRLHIEEGASLVVEPEATLNVDNQ